MHYNYSLNLYKIKQKGFLNENCYQKLLQRERELVAKALLFMVVPFIIIGCGGSEANTNNPPVTNPINNAPTINTPFTNIELQENNGTTNYELNISDADGDALTLSVESNDTYILTVTQNWTDPILQATYNSSSLDFNLTTVADAFGTVRVTVTVDDGEDNATTSFDVNVTEAITHNGTSYATVTSPYTGTVWLDRNLGASQVCTDLNDTACYGDHYQWGRNYDGHQESNSTTTPTQATNINSAGTDFITESSGSFSIDWARDADSDGALRSANWSAIDGSSVCPVGYRVPTITELRDETTAASTAVANNADAFNNFLKLPSAGVRENGGGSMSNQGSIGYVWSSSVTNSNSNYLFFESGSASSSYTTGRARGLSVRCLKH